jgi:hypothetical protein
MGSAVNARRTAAAATERAENRIEDNKRMENHPPKQCNRIHRPSAIGIRSGTKLTPERILVQLMLPDATAVLQLVYRGSNIAKWLFP